MEYVFPESHRVSHKAATFLPHLKIKKNSRVLMFAGDIKLCRQYKDIWTYHRIYIAFKYDNVLSLNGSKCKEMTFSLINPIHAAFTLCGCS